MKNDTIYRQAAIAEITEYGCGDSVYMSVEELKRRIEHLPSAQPETHGKRTETHACDCISREAAIDALDCINGVEEVLRALPPAQPEPLSDAYMKAVWTWLLNYQIKVAELKGRYTPYEVLSWVANDWRKEYE